jgi:MOSC domain-containing protein
MTRVGTLVELWRYPVKSMLGAPLDAAVLDAKGVQGDRRYAVRDTDGKIGSGKNTRRFRRMDGLLDITARYAEDGVVELTLPGGRPVRADDPELNVELRAHLGLDHVALVHAEDPFVDVAALHLVSRQSLDWLAGQVDVRVDARRLRPNLVVDTTGAAFIEDGWVDRVVRIGPEVRIRGLLRTERCVMTNAPQPGLERSGSVLKAIADGHDLTLGVQAEVLTGGRLRLGDEVRLE